MLTADDVALIGGVSKRAGPGVLADGVARGGWTAPGLAFVAAIGWLENGTGLAVASVTREDAQQRQALAAEALAVRCDPRSYHVWLVVPEAGRADTFCAAAARLGIAISPSGAFAIQPGHAPAAVRIALAVLRQALGMLAGLARSDGDMLVE